MGRACSRGQLQVPCRLQMTRVGLRFVRFHFFSFLFFSTGCGFQILPRSDTPSASEYLYSSGAFQASGSLFRACLSPSSVAHASGKEQSQSWPGVASRIGRRCCREAAGAGIAAGEGRNRLCGVPTVSCGLGKVCIGRA